ncbi:MAG: formate C-acetyltransferase/glycerol dehydratase family glycyl radical enzyme, partial [bacterium]|nr:formate C-acetyltransferase/glycerol dehydratase family glycyl radical enzyme [bacterium]
MNERIEQLREQSLNAVNRICSERAYLVTEFYKTPTAREVSVPMQRALAFKHIMENKTVCINPNELMVGERGTEPKATPTYPEICIHTVRDLDILDTREKISYAVDNHTRKTYEEEIIPSWQGKSIRDRIFNQLPPDWIAAFEAGVFTEFLEQRPPGHSVLGDK